MEPTIKQRRVLVRRHDTTSGPFQRLSDAVLQAHVWPWLDTVDEVHVVHCCRRLACVGKKARKVFVGMVGQRWPKFFFPWIRSWGQRGTSLSPPRWGRMDAKP